MQLILRNQNISSHTHAGGAEQICPENNNFP